MAKNIVPKRIPEQNIVSGVIPVIGENDWLRFFVKDSSVSIRSGVSSDSYRKFLFAPSSEYSVESAGGSGGGGGGRPEEFESVSLSSLEDITSEIYFDSLGNPKVKYILKIRNLAIDKGNVVGVDARIYNPFA